MSNQSESNQEAQDEIQEDTTSMEDKLEALDGLTKETCPFCNDKLFFKEGTGKKLFGWHLKGHKEGIVINYKERWWEETGFNGLYYGETAKEYVLKFKADPTKRRGELLIPISIISHIEQETRRRVIEEVKGKMPEEQKKPASKCINAENHLFGNCFSCVLRKDRRFQLRPRSH